MQSSKGNLDWRFRITEVIGMQTVDLQREHWVAVQKVGWLGIKPKQKTRKNPTTTMKKPQQTKTNPYSPHVTTSVCEKTILNKIQIQTWYLQLSTDLQVKTIIQ